MTSLVFGKVSLMDFDLMDFQSKVEHISDNFSHTNEESCATYK
jgi:hypothetical protein